MHEQAPINHKLAYAKWARIARRNGVAQDPLSAETAKRHAQTLELVNVPQGPVLDIGCGMGFIPRTDLAAKAVRLDWVVWPGKKGPDVIADAYKLPFAAQRFSLAWSNLCLPWIGDPLAFFREALRVIQPGGLLTLTTLGPDTLSALRERMAGKSPRTLGFFDMHDLADLAMAAGFAEPVALRENIAFAYEDGRSMLDELRTFGALASTGTACHIGHKGAIAAMAAGAGRMEIDFEIIHMHAWAMPRRKAKVPDMWQEMSFQHSLATRDT